MNTNQAYNEVSEDAHEAGRGQALFGYIDRLVDESKDYGNYKAKAAAEIAYKQGYSRAVSDLDRDRHFNYLKQRLLRGLLILMLVAEIAAAGTLTLTAGIGFLMFFVAVFAYPLVTQQIWLGRKEHQIRKTWKRCSPATYAWCRRRRDRLRLAWNRVRCSLRFV